MPEQRSPLEPSVALVAAFDGDPARVEAGAEHANDGLDVSHIIGSFQPLPVLKYLTAKIGVELNEGLQCRMIRFHSLKFKARRDSALVAFAP
jgi:hypothetical protein